MCGDKNGYDGFKCESEADNGEEQWCPGGFVCFHHEYGTFLLIYGVKSRQKEARNSGEHSGKADKIPHPYSIFIDLKIS